MIYLLALLSFAATSAFAQFSSCPQHFPTAPPVITGPALRELCFDAFVVLHSGVSKTPVYSVEKLTPETLALAAGEPRTNRFFADARLPSAERATLEDYAYSGYDRGHMSPAGDMPNAQAMAQSFSLANMVPQAPENNRGVWAKSVELATRKYVQRAGHSVFVFTGPVYVNGATWVPPLPEARPAQTLGPNHVWVPTYLFKLVYDPTANRAWAYWVENTAAAKAGPPISYDELTKRLGVKLLGSLTPGA